MCLLVSRDTVCCRQVWSGVSGRWAHALAGPQSADGAVRPFHGDVLAYWGGSRCNALHLEQQVTAQLIVVLSIVSWRHIWWGLQGRGHLVSVSIHV